MKESSDGHTPAAQEVGSSCEPQTLGGVSLETRLACGFTMGQLLEQMRDICRPISVKDYKVRVACERYGHERTTVANITFMHLKNGNLAVRTVDVEESVDDPSVRVTGTRIRASLRCQVCRTNAPVHVADDIVEWVWSILGAQQAVPPEHRVIRTGSDGVIEIPLKVIADVLGTRRRGDRRS